MTQAETETPATDSSDTAEATEAADAKAFDVAVVHYCELGLKGGNRRTMEEFLMNNIRRKLGYMIKKIRRETGKITLMLSDAFEEEAFIDPLKRIPGIAYFSMAKKVSMDLDELKAAALEFVKDIEFTTLKVDTRRHDKSYPLKGLEISRQVGGYLFAHLEGKRAQMKNPDLMLKVEITHTAAYLSAGRINGPGGLPTDKRQKVVALISGGLDSPVAAYTLMKCGCEVTMVHFQNANQMTDAVEDKVQQLARQIGKYQVKTRLIIVTFEDLQKHIIMTVKASQRMLVYRHVMLNLAANVADKIGAPFLVVGDSSSQVASQTHENLAATYAGCPKHILSPLIGMDKVEITAISKEIGTYDGFHPQFGIESTDHCRLLWEWKIARRPA